MRNFYTVVLLFLTVTLTAQNRIGLQAGYLGSYTAVAEYERVERRDYLLDSVDLQKTTGFLQLAAQAEIGLGKGVYLQTGLHYSRKGFDQVTFTDSSGFPWTTAARQHYAGVSGMVGYRHHFKESKWSLSLSSGFQVDFAVGTPNGGALFSGPYHRFFMPFCRFNEVDLTWATEGGVGYQVGPGSVDLKIKYLYGLSDVTEDPYVIGRSMSLGIAVGYSIDL